MLSILKNQCFFIGLIFLLLLSKNVFAQKKLAQQLNDFNAILGQEKIYVQTDRTFYKPGQTIWFSVYTLDEGLQFSNKSTHLRAELIEPSGAVQQSILLKSDNTGSVAGDFLIDKTNKGGWYRLRVYTDWMEKTTQAYFEKEINIQAIVYSNVLMELDFEKESYGAGSTVRASLNLLNLSNQAIRHQKVNYTIALDGKSILTSSTKTNKDGKALVQFKLPTQLTSIDGLINFKLEHQEIIESISKSIPIVLNQVELQFLPEGGNYLEGEKQRVAFIAKNEFGDAVDVIGILCHGKDTICTFESYHQGMGSFEFSPQSSTEKYNIQIIEPAGILEEFPLDWESQKGALTINVLKQDKNELEVNLLARSAQEVMLCLQMEGKLLYYKRFRTKKGSNTLTIPTDSLPIGIAQITVFDQKDQPQTERLAFVNKHKQLRVNIKTNKDQYQSRESIELNIEVLDHDSMPVQGVFSLAVVDEKNLTVADDKQNNILSQLLLTADIKGVVQEPNFYFDPSESKADIALDYVLLTHGWRRFEWQSLLKESKIDWQSRIKKIEDNAFIKGMATVNHIPLKNQLVLFTQKPHSFFGTQKSKAITWAKTDQNGAFILEKKDLPFPSYLSANYRGVWAAAQMKEATAGVYEAELIESERRTPYGMLNRSNYDDLAYTGRSSYRGSSRNYYGRSSVSVSYGENNLAVSHHEHQTGVAYEGVVKGKVNDLDLLDVLPYATITLNQGGSIVKGTVTDEEGAYYFYNVKAGTYTLSVLYPGYAAYSTELTLGTNKGDIININMATEVLLDAIVGVDGSRGVVTVTASRADYLREVGSAVLSANRISRSLRSMSRSQKTKRKTANKHQSNVVRRGIKRPRRIQSTSTFEEESYGPMNRYNFLDEQMDWKTNTTIRFNVEQVKALNYYKARTFANIKPSKYRSKNNFEETVYWNPTFQTDSLGKAKMSFYTSDAVSTFSIVMEGQGQGSLGRQEKWYVTKDEIEVEAKTPSMITVGDTLIIPVLIKNNLPVELNGILEVQLNNKTQVLAVENIVIPANGYLTQNIPLLIHQKFDKKNFIVLNFQSSKYRERFEYPIKILNKGFPREEAMSSNAPVFQQTLQVNAPIDGSLDARFYAAPNPLNALSESIMGIVRIPSGCFEQVSAKNYPNILALQYMDAMGIENIEKRTEILKYLKLGYEKLVAYETDLGGFEWYGDTPPHLGLTAHGLLQFKEMQSVYDGVEEAMMERVTQWILNTKDGQGGFNQEGGRYGFSSKNKLITNAYVVYALSEVNELDIEKELEKATLEALESKDLYRLGLVILSHWNYRNKKEAKRLLAILEEEIRAKKLEEVTAESSITNSYGRSLNIEVLSIAVLAMLEIKPKKNPLLEACRAHILTQRKGGIFGNTQGTIWALKALIEYEKKHFRVQGVGECVLKINGKVAKEIIYGKNVNDQIDINNLATHFQQGKNTVEILWKVEKGEVPTYSLDLNWMELLPQKDTACVVAVQTQIASDKPKIGETVRLTTYLKNKSNETQASTVALIGIPAGLRLQAWQIKALQDQKKVDYIELMDEYIVLHYRDLEPQEEHIIHLDLKTEFVGSFEAPSSSAYLYYHDELKDWSAGTKVEVLP